MLKDALRGGRRPRQALRGGLRPRPRRPSRGRPHHRHDRDVQRRPAGASAPRPSVYQRIRGGRPRVAIVKWIRQTRQRLTGTGNAHVPRSSSGGTRRKRSRAANSPSASGTRTDRPARYPGTAAAGTHRSPPRAAERETTARSPDTARHAVRAGVHFYVRRPATVTIGLARITGGTELTVSRRPRRRKSEGDRQDSCGGLRPHLNHRASRRLPALCGSAPRA
jgi:hypothetical protein